MKKVFIFLFFIAAAVCQLNCAKANDNSKSANAGLPTAESNQVNANVKTEGTPLPIFTNADEALAEGKKMLDAIETERAIDALRQAVKLNPDLAEAYFNLGIAYSLTEKEEEDLAKTQTEPTPTPAKSGKKETVERTKNSEKAFDNAVKAYKKILAQNSKDDVAQFNLGRAYNKLNEDEDALKALREAVKLKPDDTEYQTELGAILIKLAQYDQAIAALKKALTLDETNLQAESLLEKAEAGQKRVDFGSKPKLPDQQNQTGKTKPKESPLPETNSAAKAEPPPAKKNTNQ